MAEGIFAVVGVLFVILGFLNRKVTALRIDKFEIELASLTPLERLIFVAIGVLLVGLASLPILGLDVPGILSVRATDTARSSQVVPCEEMNLLSCSDVIPVFVPDHSSVTLHTVPNGLEIGFDNQPDNTTGVALQFEPPLDVAGYRYLEVRGKTGQPIDLGIEYKADQDRGLETVKSSDSQILPASLGVSTIRVEIVYGGPIQELVINFPKVGQTGQLTAMSIRLVR